MLWTIAVLAFDPLDARNGEFLHIRRLHSHSSCLGDRRGLDPADSRKKPGSLRIGLVLTAQRREELTARKARRGKFGVCN